MIQEYIYFSVHQVGNDMCELLEGFEKRQDNIVIEKDGNPLGVIVPIAEYRQMQNQLLRYMAGVIYEDPEEKARKEADGEVSSVDMSSSEGSGDISLESLVEQLKKKGTFNRSI